VDMPMMEELSGWAQLPEELVTQVLELLGRERSVVRLLCSRWRSLHDRWAEQRGWAGLSEELLARVMQHLQPQPADAALGFFECPTERVVVANDEINPLGLGVPALQFVAPPGGFSTSEESTGVLQATGQPSRQEPKRLGFHQVSAKLSTVCARWRRLHDALVKRLVVSYRVTDEQMHMLVQRFPAATSVQVSGPSTNPRLVTPT